VIPNGVDVGRFKPCEPDAELAASIGATLGAPTAAIVAALRPEKNHELFLAAAARVRRHVPAAQFLVIGDGPRRGELEQRATELGIRDAVRFLGTRCDVPQLLGLTDVLVLSSHMEANPVSILEGLACGKPVVATRVGSISETVLEGVNGFLVDPGSEEQLAARIHQLFTDLDRARQMGSDGRQTVVAGWSLERMVDGYQGLIASVYGKKSGKWSEGAPQKAEFVASGEPVWSPTDRTEAAEIS